MAELSYALEHCLFQLARGEATLEECLAQYPEYANELHRLILTADQIEQQGRAVVPTVEFKNRARAQLQIYLREHPRSPRGNFGFGGANWRFGVVLQRIFNVAAGLAAVILLFFLTGTVLAQAALPGDPLYSWRIVSENLWRAIHPNPLKADLALTARRARDLSQVVGDPQAEIVARQEYQQSLTDLSNYADPAFQDILSEALNTQKATLKDAQVTIPELDELLQKVARQQVNLSVTGTATTVEIGRVSYTLAVLNQGPASPVTATLVSSYWPADAVVSVAGNGCNSLNPVGGGVGCIVDNLILNTPQTLTITAALNPCYSGLLTSTVAITGTTDVINSNPDNAATIENNITLSFPAPANVAYVQSNGQAHHLGLVTSTGQILDYNLHARAAAPAWSPDGAKLAFFGEAGISELGTVYGQGNGLWIIGVGTGQEQNPEQLVAQDHIKNIVWSPDGTKLAFEVEPPNQTARIVIVDSRDGRQISSFPGSQPAWSADSQKLAIKDCAPACGLWQANFDGSDTKQLTFEATDSYPAWSPTGEHLAFTSHRDDNWEVYRLNLANGQLVRLTNRPATDITPVFGPCGQDIYLRTDQFGSWWITVMKLDGRDEHKVAEGVGPSDDWGLARPAVH